MACQPRHQRAVGGVPYIHSTIIAPTSDLAAVRAPGHGTNPGREIMRGPLWTAGDHVPNQHPMPIGSAGQALPVGTPGYAVEVVAAILRVVKHLCACSGRNIPQPDDIPLTAGQRAAIETPSDPECDA